MGNLQGWWATHDYHRRNVERGVEKFEGWRRIAELVRSAKEKGDARKDHNGDRDAAMTSCLFLGGFRVGEGVEERFPGGELFSSGLMRDNVKVLEDENPPVILFDNVKTLKAHRKVKGSDWWEDPATKTGHHYDSVRLPLFRTFPIPLDEPEDVVQPFLSYVAKAPEGLPLFPITPTRAYQIIEAVDPSVWPHWFRAQRAAQLAREYGFKLHDLMEFFQWKEMKTALRYASMGYSALMEKLPKQKVNRVW